MVRGLMTDADDDTPHERPPAAAKPPKAGPRTLTAQQAREAREAAALRENLKRRKAAARMRSDG